MTRRPLSQEYMAAAGPGGAGAFQSQVTTGAKAPSLSVSLEWRGQCMKGNEEEQCNERLEGRARAASAVTLGGKGSRFHLSLIHI